MATNTTNFDLVKPAGSDNYDIDSFHNGSMDKIDSALQGLGTGLAIISKNNTHGVISSGEYVYVHGHGSLAEGLYKANTNIAANGTLTSSNLTAVSGGLGAQVASLSNQIAKYAYVSELSDTVNAGSNGSVVIPLPAGATTLLALIPFGASPSNNYDAMPIINSNPVLSTRTISFYARGSGAQKYRIFCLAIYV